MKTQGNEGQEYESVDKPTGPSSRLGLFARGLSNLQFPRLSLRDGCLSARKLLKEGGGRRPKRLDSGHGANLGGARARNAQLNAVRGIRLALSRP